VSILVTFDLNAVPIGLLPTLKYTYLFVQKTVYIHYMIEQMILKYWCENLQIGINSVHDFWMLQNRQPVKLKEEVYRWRI
jgi:hypothetical protein